MSLGSAIGSDVANASTTKTFFVCFALPPNFGVAFALIMPRFGEDFLAVSDFQKVHFSVFTFYELVTAGIVIADLFVQMSLHHRLSQRVPSSVHSPETDAAVLSTLSGDLWYTWR